MLEEIKRQLLKIANVTQVTDGIRIELTQSNFRDVARTLKIPTHSAQGIPQVGGYLVKQEAKQDGHSIFILSDQVIQTMPVFEEQV